MKNIFKPYLFNNRKTIRMIAFSDICVALLGTFLYGSIIYTFFHGIYLLCVNRRLGPGNELLFGISGTLITVYIIILWLLCQIPVWKF